MTALTDRVQAAARHATLTAPAAIEAGGIRVAAGLPQIAQTGYYGRYDAAGRMRVTKTHVRLAGESGPLCGSRLHPDMTFHFCAARVERRYVECESCLAAADRLKQQAA